MWECRPWPSERDWSIAYQAFGRVTIWRIAGVRCCTGEACTKYHRPCWFCMINKGACAILMSFSLACRSYVVITASTTASKTSQVCEILVTHDLRHTAQSIQHRSVQRGWNRLKAQEATARCSWTRRFLGSFPWYCAGIVRRPTRTGEMQRLQDEFDNERDSTCRLPMARCVEPPCSTS
jgi:hypothetical protein